MLSTPRRQAGTRLAAGAVLAATTLATGAFAAIGTTAAQADTAPGSYAQDQATSWDNAPATTSVTVADQISSLSSATVTLHNFTDNDVTALNVVLTDPSGSTIPLEAPPATMAGGTSVNGQDITFAPDGSGEASGAQLTNEVGQPGTGTWTLTFSDDNGTPGSISGWSLDLTEAPIVVTSPQDISANSGDNATFPAAAEGVPTPTVQWESSTDGNNWTPIEGATSPSYSVNGVTTAMSGTGYRAVFTSAAGTATSDPAWLSVTGNVPTVTQQPVNVTVIAGSTPSFTSSATGDPAVTSMQWQQSTDGGQHWNPIAGATSTSYTLDHAASLADNGMMFEEIFYNDQGQTPSNPATLTVTGTVPSAPRGVWANQSGPGTITIHWAPSASAGTPATIDYYQPGYSGGQFGNGDAVPASATSDSFKNLTPGHYTASVAAVNAAGSSTRIFVPVTVVAPTTTPVAHASASHVVAGGKFTLAGTGPKSATLTIQRALPGKGFVKLTTVKTNSWGAYSIAIPATHTAAYRVVSSAGKISSKVTVAAAYAVHVQTVRTAARAYAISGWITPVAAGRTVHVTATVAGQLVKIATLTTSPKGKFAMKGPVTLHVTVSSSALNTAGSLSKALTVS